MSGGWNLWRVAAALAACAATAGALHAQTVRIRSGEHGGFTRIVAESGMRDGWVLGRAEGGYELRLGQPADYDLANAFRLIGRDRVASLSPGRLPGSLAIGLGCDCHATAFETPEGALVIDVAEGPPPAGSPFEGLLPAPAPALDPAMPGEAAPADATTGVDTGRVDTVRNSPGFAAAATADPKLALFWQGVRLPAAGTPGPASATPTPAAPSTGTNRPPPVGPAGAPATITRQADGHQPHPSAAKATPAGAGTLPPDTAPLPADAPAPVQDTIRSEDADTIAIDGAPGAPAAGVPPLPDARVTEAQTELLRQLGRAASQGLVEIETKPHRHADEAGRGPLPPAGGVAAPAESTGPAPEALPVHAETSVDRDTLSAGTRPPVTAEGGACLPDEVFDIAAWGDGRPLTIQIAERRAALVGEFDRPSPEAVVALARLYLHFGFGAESRAVLRAFDVTPGDGAVLADMSRILDGAPPGAGASFAGMTGCDTSAALWAVMAWPALPPVTDVNAGAVVRAFSALPAHLRRVLGPGLVERLMSTGAAGAAYSVRNAIARAPDDGGRALDMVEARIDLASGDPETGERRLDALARSNDPLSAGALMLTIQSRLQRGEAVEPALADSAEALAFEQQDGPDGPRLASLHILARASTGDFDRAFAGFRGWPSRPTEALRAETAGRLFTMLVGKADDETFLRHYFRHREAFEAAAPDVLLRLDLADRLAGAGFPDEVRHVLKGEAAYSERGRQLLARAALDEAQPAEALAQLSGLAGPAAERLRAEALAAAGDHAAAATQFGALGEGERAALEAWRGGDLRTASSGGPEPLRSALGALDRSAAGGQAAGAAKVPATSGPLASGRALIEETRATRTAIEALLAATPMPSASVAAAPTSATPAPAAPPGGGG